MYRTISILDNGTAIVENVETGDIKRVDAPKFKDREVVSTTIKHFSQKQLTRVINPSYTDNRGWVYTENYINEDGSSGGCGCWFEEDLFQNLETLELRLKARLIEIKDLINCNNRNNDILKKELEKVEYALKQ